MKGKQEIKAILLGIGMGLLAMPSCSDDVINPDDRPENGAIMLQVGVSNSPAQQPLTRAAGDTYVALNTGTKFKLRVQGTWTRNTSSEEIIKTTTATAGAAQSFTAGTAAGTENSLTFDPVLYWDDYGTGDPANAATGRTKGLDILAVAVDNATTEILDGEWTGTKSWTLQTDGTKVLTKDILVANNLSDEKTPGRLTFAHRKEPDKSRLIFRHLMSKITFNLKPADGFMQTDGRTYAFTNSPTVELNRKRYEGGTLPTGGDYALVEGTINIREAVATPSPTSMKKITAGDETKKEEGGAEVRTQVALVYPGTCLGETDNDVVARIAADNNYYYVTAKEIRAAINAAGGHTDYKTLPGYNYIINVTVKKTGVNVTATVTNWVDVKAEEASPVIALTAGAGGTGETGDWATTDVKGFDFFRSTAKLTGYSDEASLKESDCYKPLRKVKWDATSGTTSPRACEFYDNTGATKTPLYWPDHDTHYHFRGVYPATTTTAVDAPQVKTYGSGAKAEQGIAVQNGAYDKTKFPSNLMIGMPEIAEGSLCGSGEHTQVDMSEKGICARSGKINMNFRYMMSQVEIELAHSLAEGTEGDVTLDGDTKVEIVGGYTEGYIRLGDREAVGQLPKKPYTTTVDASDAKKLKRHDIVLPQELTGMQFKITVNNADGTTKDYYYATIKDIRVRVGEGASQSITKWEPGKHYKYTLKLKKTAMEITATLTDWITVEADEDIWM